MNSLLTRITKIGKFPITYCMNKYERMCILSYCLNFNVFCLFHRKPTPSPPAAVGSAGEPSIQPSKEAWPSLQPGTTINSGW